jgi:hypothetical protein
MITDFDEDLTTIIDKNDTEYKLVKFVKPHFILTWKLKEVSSGERTHICKGIKVTDFTPEELTKHDLWDKISAKNQKLVHNVIKEETDSVKNRLEKARSLRKEKYPHIPKELTCTVCNDKIKIQPSVIAKRIETKKILIDDYIKNYKCIKCGGRGRTKNIEFAKLPKTIKCKCGKEVLTNAAQLKIKASKNKTTIEELIKNFSCQSCSPSKRGRKKGKKNAK